MILITFVHLIYLINCPAVYRGLIKQYLSWSFCFTWADGGGGTVWFASPQFVNLTFEGL